MSSGRIVWLVVVIYQFNQNKKNIFSGNVQHELAYTLAAPVLRPYVSQANALSNKKLRYRRQTARASSH